jgi:hypothetical protein
VRRYFILATKKCCIYAAFGVLQTPNKIDKKEEKLKSSYPHYFRFEGKIWLDLGWKGLTIDFK